MLQIFIPASLLLVITRVVPGQKLPHDEGGAMPDCRQMRSRHIRWSPAIGRSGPGVLSACRWQVLRSETKRIKIPLVPGTPIAQACRG